MCGFLFLTSFARAQYQGYVGSYQTVLVALPSMTPKGLVEVTVGSTGVATGKIILSGDTKVYSFNTKTPLTVDSGSIYVNRLVVVKGQFPLPTIQALEMNLRIYDSGNITGAVECTKGPALGTYSMKNPLKLATFTGKADSIAPWTGIYTVATTSPGDAGAEVPAGAGYGNFTVKPTGDLGCSLILGDGTKLTASAKPTADGVYRLYATPYKAGGVFSSVVDLSSETIEQAESAVWSKTANDKDKVYKAGFATELNVFVAPWIKLTTSKVPALFTTSKNFNVDFSGEGLSEADFNNTLPDTARFVATGAIQAVSGGAGAPADNKNADWNKLWNVKVDPAKGTFSGQQVLRTVVNGKPKDTKIPVAGVLLLGDAIGEDVFALGQYTIKPTEGTPFTGQVSFSGPLTDNVSVALAGTYTMTMNYLSVADVTGSLGGSTINNPALPPKGSPANNASVTFSLSDDQQTLTFAGTKIPLQSQDALAAVYSNASASPQNNKTITIYRSLVTGEITSVGGLFFQATVSGTSVRSQTLIFQSANGSVTKQ